MKMSEEIPIFFGLLFVMHCLPTLGVDVEVKPTEKSEPPINDRSSHQHTHFLSTSHQHKDPPFQGFWKKKFIWRPRWIKTWQEKKIYVAVWKKMWGPAIVKEWVPVPKPPPGWIKHETGNYFVKGY